MTSATATTGGTRRRGTRDLSRPPTTASKAPAAATGEYDVPLVVATVVLVGLGLILVYSSSSVFASRVYDDSEHFLKLQAAWVVVGIAGAMLASRLTSGFLRAAAPWALIASLLLLALVLVPGIGHEAGGARRWLTLGSVGFQPSELGKLAVVIVLAAILARRDERKVGERSSLLVPVVIAQIPLTLILLEPDLGTALVIELIVAVMVFSAGLRLRTLLLGGLAALPIFYHAVMGTQYRLQRVLSFIDPWAYRTTVGYQVTEALISIGSGGLAGVGLGESKHKLFFLPEAHTDFIFAILGEELGFIGAILLLAAFGVLIARGIRAATHARSGFDGYLAIGLTALIGVPAVFNVCVATGLLPTKGLPLPLVSYGGSNLVATLIAVGLLARILRDGRTAKPEEAS